MAGTAQDVFEEHLSVIAALRDNYARRDDVGSVSAIFKLQEELAALCSSREEQARSAIKGWLLVCHPTPISGLFAFNPQVLLLDVPPPCPMLLL
jgi:hypothetical protein